MGLGERPMWSFSATTAMPQRARSQGTMRSGTREKEEEEDEVEVELVAEGPALQEEHGAMGGDEEVGGEDVERLRDGGVGRRVEEAAR